MMHCYDDQHRRFIFAHLFYKLCCWMIISCFYIPLQRNHSKTLDVFAWGAYPSNTSRKSIWISISSCMLQISHRITALLRYVSVYLQLTCLLDFYVFDYSTIKRLPSVTLTLTLMSWRELIFKYRECLCLAINALRLFVYLKSKNAEFHGTKQTDIYVRPLW